MHLLAEVLVRDGYKVIVDNMTLGKIIHEPTGSSPELNEYRRAFGSSVTWLSGYTTANTPKAFSDVFWGTTAINVIWPIRPTAIENVTVTAGTWEAVRVEWLSEDPLWEYRDRCVPRIMESYYAQSTTGGPVIQAWVVDEFPFPIKATTLHYITEGPPPRSLLDSHLEILGTALTSITEGPLPEYEFVLRDYEQGVQENPFEGIASTDYSGGCLVATAAYGGELAPQVQLLR